MKRVLIIAGNGFIGSRIKTIFNEDAEVESIIVLDERDSRFQQTALSKVINIKCSLEDMTVIKNAILDYQISHIVYLYSATVPATSNNMIDIDIKNNLLHLIAILDIAVELNIKKIVYASSGGAIYGNINDEFISEETCSNPISSYGIIKNTCEQYLGLYNKLYGLSFISLRISNPFGPMQDPNAKQGVVAKFIYYALNKQIFEIWGDGNIIKDYIFIDDVARAFLKSLNIDYCGNINIGSGVGVSLNDLIDTIEKILNIRVERKYIPKKSHDVERNVLSIIKAKGLLGWQSNTTLHDSILETIDWQKQYFKL
ncbi:NAD-dependent epimerase/dehydratase family protein [Sulfuricurvum sp.]|uniref:NAD-dependent epimerase/dehydratase family protein n=1 Tax=Sulfuricurvum sp. TaxID=2025608 RepID=UPI003BB6DB98